MSYEDDDVGFKTEGDVDDELLEPLEEGAINDFRFDEDTDDDPDKDH